MTKYLIEGGKRLSGKVTVSGNKNAILPCLAAALLTDEDVILRNVPKISDVDVFLEMLQFLGAEVEYAEHQVKVNCRQIRGNSLPEELVSKLRASVLFVGPLLARTKKVELFHPGGDVIGRRSIDVHLEGLKNLGFNLKTRDRWYKISGSQSQDRQIYLGEPSVTATENLILSLVLGKSTVVIKNCAKEPHVTNLCRMLTGMGALIEGIGDSTLKIKGMSKLHGTDFTIGADYVEFGTYAVAAALTKGEIEIENISLEELDPVVYPLEKMGLNFTVSGSSVIVGAKTIKSIPALKTNIWPGFPTDAMSLAIVLATQGRGVSLCHDWMYESRMFFVDKLISMGANITLADPHRVLVYGPSPLYGRNLETPDIRAGMALVLAALTARGTSIINRAELIERGYEKVVDKLLALGAEIKRLD